MDRFAAAHRRVQHPTFPRVAEAGVSGGRAFVSFAIAPLCDGEQAIARLGEERLRVSYAQAIAVVGRLGDALVHAHATRGEDGRPLALGGMGWANVVVARDGSPYLLGLGHNVIGRDEQDALAGVPSFFVPPELARGGRPTPSADAYAFVTLQRSVLSYCELPSALERVFAGAAGPHDRALAEIVQWSTERVLGAEPERRGSVAQLRERWLREWSLLGVRPDLDGLRATLASICASGASASSEHGAHPRELLVGPEASWFRAPDGLERRLDSRCPLKRILLRLAVEHSRGTGQPLAPDELLAAGWPGQRVSREAGLNRVYVAIALLRKLGLRELVQRDDRGYRIDPTLAIRFARSAELRGARHSGPSA